MGGVKGCGRRTIVDFGLCCCFVVGWTFGFDICASGRDGHRRTARVLTRDLSNEKDNSRR
jgi:hypothetical protein